MVAAGGVAELLREVRQHRLDDARIGPRRRVVVKIDWQPKHSLSPIASGRAWARRTPNPPASVRKAARPSFRAAGAAAAGPDRLREGRTRRQGVPPNRRRAATRLQAV